MPLGLAHPPREIGIAARMELLRFARRWDLENGERDGHASEEADESSNAEGSDHEGTSDEEEPGAPPPPALFVNPFSPRRAGTVREGFTP